ncbi:MAG TPA: hypothetical protein ENI37_05925 [Chloroflexi bacterium]|nr:hypothetical protein [Chloroflexota bacterium]
MTGLLGSLQITGTHVAALLLTVLALLLLFLLIARARAGHRPHIRSLPPFDLLSAELGRSAESGKPLHLTMGSGGLGGDRTLASLAALEILEGLADAAVAYGMVPLVTVGDPTLLPLAEDVLRRAHIRRGIPDRYNPATVRFVAAQPATYAVGAADVIKHERVRGNVVIGSFEEEVSLITCAGEGRGLLQATATDRLQGLGALYPADARLAVGEELYAGVARLTGFPRHLASLQVQDVLRFLLVAVIVLRVFGAF